jgi:hypothetical protein
VQPLLEWESNEYCIFESLLSCMQCARAILSSVVYPAVPNVSTLSHKRHDYRKVTERKIVFWFSL